MIYIYRKRGSSSARLLARKISELGTRARRTRRLPVLKPGDQLINWGEAPPPIRSKYGELVTLAKAGVEVPEHSQGIPPREEGDWLPRSNSHVGGNDLLRLEKGLPVQADYWTLRVPFKAELRLHIFDEVTIRVGLKVPVGDEHHPWIRSRDAGWHLAYGDMAQKVVRQRHRDTAKAAVKALGLRFGAVDLGIRADGTPVVLEVNRAPGLDNATAMKYARKILGLPPEKTQTQPAEPSRT